MPATPSTVDGKPDTQLRGVLGLVVGLVRSGALRKMTGAEAKHYLALLSHYPHIHPGLDVLAEETGLHRMTASKANRALERLGALTVARDKGLGNTYKLVVPELTGICPQAYTYKSPGLGGISPQANRVSAPRLTEVSKGRGQEKRTREVSATRGRRRPPSADKSSARGRRGHDKDPAPNAQPGKPWKPTATVDLPDGFAEWLTHLNRALGLQPPKGYTTTSAMGGRLAAQYARVLAKGRFDESDLLRAVDAAAAKAARGYRNAHYPNWILANLEELINEPEPRFGGNGRPGAPIFRTGADLEEHKRRMRSVVQRPTSDGR